MGALNPIFLTAAVAVAVPIFLHLFQRHEARRFSFPALRYLERTEKEHARRIKLRQLLLLLIRVAVLLLLVAAGARLVVSGRGASHPPTAVAIVLDNSLSSGLVVGETRVLDELEAMADQALEEATDEDRFWVIRAGEPWLPAIPGNRTEARAAVDSTQPSDGAGDLTAALERAAGLLRTSDLPEREIHLLSDMQRTGFQLPGAQPAGDIPVVAWVGQAPPEENRALTSVLVGGGLPPLEGQRTALTVRALSGGEDTARWAVRVVMDGRVRGAGELGPGAEASIALPPTGAGWVTGYADADPDALRADDRRYFAYRSRSAPRVALGGTPGLFLGEAISVLEQSGRVASTAPGAAELLVAPNGVGLDTRGSTTAALVVPPDDVTLLPALNRRLAEAGIGWRYRPGTSVGMGTLEGESLPESLSTTRITRWYALEPTAEEGETRALAEIAGDPWALEGTDVEGRRYLLLASPLSADATSLPVSTGMVRFVDWVATEWAGAGGAAEHTVGDRLPAPPGATRVRFPSGRELEIDATRVVRGTGEAGPYTFLDADTTVAVVALNPPPSESRLAPIDEDDLETAVGPEVTLVSDADDWARETYRSRRGPELWWPLLLVACLLLLAEAFLAASGRDTSGGAPRRRPVAAGA